MVITVSNQKGGVGKTTTSAALAAGFSMAGKKVLCIDLDPQGNLGFCLGLDTEGGSTILDVLKGDISIQKAISRTEGIDILPSDITLSSSGLEYNPGEEKESILKYRELSENGKSLVRLIIDEEYKRMNQSEYINLPFYRPGIRKVHSGFLFQDTTQTIRVRRKHVPKDSDFCFQVLIDRYQPVFQKNDILALQRINASHNEIGLFWFNGIYYIRILSEEGSIRRLRSLNVIDPDIVVNEQDQLECIGKIHGKVYGNYEIYGTCEEDETIPEHEIEIQ